MVNEKRVYKRNPNGTLDVIELPVIDGEVCDRLGHPLTPTTGKVALYGHPDCSAVVHTTDGGLEILVPTTE